MRKGLVWLAASLVLVAAPAFAQKITATLPKYLKRDGKAVEISIDNCFINKQGFTGNTTVQPVFAVGNGSVGGWAFSMEKFELGITNNTLTKGAFNGKLKLPIAKTEIGYSCLLSNSDAGLKTAFEVSTLDDIDVDVRNNDGGALNSRHADFWNTAFVGDLRVGMVWRWGALMNFRLGYQAMLIDGLAIAPNQNNNLSFATGSQSVDVGSVVYQGGYIGFDLSW